VQRGEPGAKVRGRRRRHPAHARPPGALLLHQRRAGAVRGGAADGRARRGRALLCRRGRRPDPCPSAGAGAGGDGALRLRHAVRRPPDTCLVQAAPAGAARVSGRVFLRRGNHVAVYELAPPPR